MIQLTTINIFLLTTTILKMKLFDQKHDENNDSMSQQAINPNSQHKLSMNNNDIKILKQ